MIYKCYESCLFCTDFISSRMAVIPKEALLIASHSLDIIYFPTSFEGTGDFICLCSHYLYVKLSTHMRVLNFR